MIPIFYESYSSTTYSMAQTSKNSQVGDNIKAWRNLMSSWTNLVDCWREDETYRLRLPLPDSFYRSQWEVAPAPLLLPPLRASLQLPQLLEQQRRPHTAPLYEGCHRHWPEAEGRLADCGEYRELRWCSITKDWYECALLSDAGTRIEWNEIIIISSPPSVLIHSLTSERVDVDGRLDESSRSAELWIEFLAGCTLTKFMGCAYPCTVSTYSDKPRSMQNQHLEWPKFISRSRPIKKEFVPNYARLQGGWPYALTRSNNLRAKQCLGQRYLWHKNYRHRHHYIFVFWYYCQ